MADETANRLAAMYVDALNGRDWDALREIVASDFVHDWPQSGERIRGVDNFREMFEHYPGDAPPRPIEAQQVFGTDERWVMTPTFTLVRVVGSEERFTIVARSRYPDGSLWYVINLVESRDGRITRTTSYFAPTYPAPEWRTQWVEPLGPQSDQGPERG